MPDETPFEGFPNSRMPDIPPWSPVRPPAGNQFDPQVGSGRASIPDRGFPFSRSFPQPFEYDFSSNRPAAALPEDAFGAFYGLRTVADGVDVGDIYLLGGQVSAGTGTDIVADILLYDASLDTWEGAEGDHLLLTISGTGDEADSVLLPVFNMTGVATSIAAAVGSNSLPAIGSLSGSCIVSLGQFGAAAFYPNLPGNVQVSFCFGGFTSSRF